MCVCVCVCDINEYVLGRVRIKLKVSFDNIHILSITDMIK